MKYEERINFRILPLSETLEEKGRLKRYGSRPFDVEFNLNGRYVSPTLNPIKNKDCGNLFGNAVTNQYGAKA